MTEQVQQLLKNANAPSWLTPEMVLIGGGVLVALLLLWLISLTFRRRSRDAITTPVFHYEEEVPPARPITPPPVMAPTPLMDEPPFVPPVPVVYAPAPEPEPVVEVAPVPEPLFDAASEPEPVPEPPFEVTLPPAYEPEPQPAPALEPVAFAPPAVEAEAPVEALSEPAPIADEPFAVDVPVVEPVVEPESVTDFAPVPSEPEPAVASPAPEPEFVTPQPVAAPAPVPAPLAPDELTRLKGVGPRLADRLNAVGITSFSQIAALTSEDAAALDAKLGDFQGRIHRDRWIDQATFLAVGDVAGFEETFGKL